MNLRDTLDIVRTEPAFFGRLRSRRIEVRSGWKELIGNVIYQLAPLREDGLFLEFGIIKQKFGSLRFQPDISGPPEVVERAWEIMRAGEADSLRTCEFCGVYDEGLKLDRYTVWCGCEYEQKGHVETLRDDYEAIFGERPDESLRYLDLKRTYGPKEETLWMELTGKPGDYLYEG